MQSNNRMIPHKETTRVLPIAEQEPGSFLFPTLVPVTAREFESLFAVFYELAAVGAVVAIPCDVIWLWTLSKVLVVLLPTALTTRMATMAINANTNPYSTND